MRILFVSSSFPPIYDMHTIRNLEILRKFRMLGFQVDIVSVEKIDLSVNDFDGENLYLKNSLPYFTWSKRISKYFGEIGLRIYNVLAVRFFRPDTFQGWHRISRELLEDFITNRDYDMVFSSSGSFLAHTIARDVKRERPEILWVADYGDPWSLDKYGLVIKRKVAKEIDTIANCDAILVTTGETRLCYLELLKTHEIDIPVYVVPCGFKPMENISTDKLHVTSIMTAVRYTYAGVAYRNDRDLMPLLQAIQLNDNSKFSICGSYSSIYKKTFESNRRFLFSERLTPKESLDFMLDSDVLVHIGNLGSLQIPGKTYTLLSLPLPILYIQQETLVHDPTAAFLMRFGGIVVTSNHTEDIGVALKEIEDTYDALKFESLKRISSTQLMEYSWENICSEMVKIVSELRV